MFETKMSPLCHVYYYIIFGVHCYIQAHHEDNDQTSGGRINEKSLQYTTVTMMK